MKSLADLKFPGLAEFDRQATAINDELLIREAKEHRNFISSGDVNMFDMCQMKVHFSKMQGEGFQCDIGFHYGMIAKRAVTQTMLYKQAHGRPPANPEAIWALPFGKDKKPLSYFWETLDESGAWVEYPKPEDLKKKKDQLDDLLEAFLSKYAWEINPMLVEKKLYLPIPGGEQFKLYMHEYIDMVDDKQNVYLFKFLSKSPSQNDETGEYQVNQNYVQNVLSYAALLRNFQLPAEGASTSIMHFVGKKESEIIPVYQTVTDKQVKAFAVKCVRLWKILVKELSIPNPGAMFCKSGVGGCSHWEICQAHIQESLNDEGLL